MKIPQSKIYKAVSDDESRFVLTQVYFDKEKRRLVAADGFAMAIVPVDDIGENETGGLIDPDAIKLAAEHGNGHLILDDERITVLGTGWSVDRPEDQYPDYEQIVRRCKTDADSAAPVLVLDAYRLYRLAQAICSGYKWLPIRIFLPHKAGDAIEIRPEVENGAKGVIMPMAHKDNENINLTPLVGALENDEEITPDMRAVLKSLLGLG